MHYKYSTYCRGLLAVAPAFYGVTITVRTWYVFVLVIRGAKCIAWATGRLGERLFILIRDFMKNSTFLFQHYYFIAQLMVDCHTSIKFELG